MQAISSEALPLTAARKGVIQKWSTKLTLTYERAGNLNKIVSYSLPNSILRVRNDQCKHFKCGFYLKGQPKKGKKG